jgi:hypothetical protein
MGFGRAEESQGPMRRNASNVTGRSVSVNSNSSVVLANSSHSLMRFQQKNRDNSPNKYSSNVYGDSNIHPSNSVKTNSFLGQRSAVKRPQESMKKIISIDLRAVQREPTRAMSPQAPKSPTILVTNTSSFNSHYPVPNNQMYKKSPAPQPTDQFGYRYPNKGSKVDVPPKQQLHHQGSKRKIQIQLQELISKSKSKF